MAGLFAVLAAAIAFYPAHRAAAGAKANAAREQWWNRAKWALELAGSDNQSDREVAKDALIALNEVATELESSMIILVISNMLQNAEIDERRRQAQNGFRRFPWRTK